MVKYFKSYNNIFKWLLRLVSLVLLLFYFFTKAGGDLNTHYITAAAIVIASSFVVDFLFWIVRLKTSKAMDFFIQLFLLFALLLGRMYDMYDIIPWWDLMLHFVAGVLFAVLFLALLKYMVDKTTFKSLTPLFVLIFISMFSIAASAIWEFWEFTGDQLFGFDSQLNSLTDTMTDMIIGAISGLLVGFACFFNKKTEGRRFKLLNSFFFTRR